MQNPNRTAILDRIRQALRRPSPEPDFLHRPAQTTSLFPLPGPNLQDRIDRFRTELEAVQGNYVACNSADEARDWLAAFAQSEHIESILAPDLPQLRALGESNQTLRWIASENASTEGWQNAGAGLTTCEALIAESGTIVVSAALSGRAISVLPPIHIVLATQDQIVPDIPAAIALLRKHYADQLPSTISFITGPSRTADIEKILVLGAHGPKRLYVLMLPQVL